MKTRWNTLCGLVLGGLMVTSPLAGLPNSGRDKAKPELHRRAGGAQPNAWLVKEVGHRLRMLPYYSVYDNLEYRVIGYRVELFGEVVWPSLRSDAEATVRRIEGVEEVVNHIEVLPPSPNDDRIRLMCYRAIFGQPVLQRYSLQAVPPIHIIVKNGNVALVGVVDSTMEKQVAYIQARSVPGVFSVTDDLRVENGRRS